MCVAHTALDYLIHLHKEKIRRRPVDLKVWFLVRVPFLGLWESAHSLKKRASGDMSIGNFYPSGKRKWRQNGKQSGLWFPFCWLLGKKPFLLQIWECGSWKKYGQITKFSYFYMQHAGAIRNLRFCPTLDISLCIIRQLWE